MNRGHRETMERLLQEYLAVDDQCVEHAGGGPVYVEFVRQRGLAARRLADNYRLLMHIKTRD